MPNRRPIAGSARSSNAAGEKSRSVMAHAVQRSVTVIVVDFPWSIFKHVMSIDRYEDEYVAHNAR